MTRDTSTTHPETSGYLIDQSVTPPHGDPERAFLTARSTTRPSLAVRGLAAGSAALGAVALGALAIGALAIGSLVIGRLVLKRGHIQQMRIGSLQVDHLDLGNAAFDDRQGVRSGR